MKRALVLSGGGSRGAYEIGAWQAMTELGVRFHGVYGASIGAINAALVAQGDPATACALWENITLKEVLATDEEDFSVAQLAQRKRDVIPFLMENAKHLRVDPAPLEALMRRHISEGKVRASGMTLGVMTVRVPQMQPVPVRLGDIKEGMLVDWLMASASCFPIFPTRKIAGERYIDGGYFDNLPVDMAISDGMDEIVAVDVHPTPAHPEYERMPFLKTIHPLRNLGGFLDFKPKLLSRMRRMGYYDAMKAYGHFDGVRYTFLRSSELSVATAARKFVKRAAAFDAEAIRRGAFQSSQLMNAPLIAALESETPGRRLSWKETYLRGLELCAQSMGFRDDAIYDPRALTAQILKFARTGGEVHALEDSAVVRASREGKRELVAYLYRVLKGMGDFPVGSVRLLSDYPAETAAALYLCCSEEA